MTSARLTEPWHDTIKSNLEMQTMKRYLVKAAVFCSLQLAILAIIWAFYNKPSKNYLAAIYDELERLDTVFGKRLITLGGSGSAFGFNSKMLKDSLGYEPVNMGLSIHLGLAAMLGSVEERVRAGDMVIL